MFRGGFTQKRTARTVTDTPPVSGTVVLVDDSGGVRDLPGRKGGRSSVADQTSGILAARRGIERGALESRLDACVEGEPLFTSQELAEAALVVARPSARSSGIRLLPRRDDVPEKATIVSLDLTNKVGQLLAMSHDVGVVLADARERVGLPPTSNALAKRSHQTLDVRPGPVRALPLSDVSWRARRAYSALEKRGTLPSGCFDGPVGFVQRMLAPIPRDKVEKLLIELIDAGLLEARVHLITLGRPDWRSLSFPRGRKQRAGSG